MFGKRLMLSNPPGPTQALCGDPAHAGYIPDPQLVIAAARPEDIRPGLRLVLGLASGPAGEGGVSEFLRFAATRGIDLARMNVVRVGKRVAFAALPVGSPGGTSILLSSSLPPDVSDWAAAEVIHNIAHAERTAGANLLQALLSPEDVSLRRCLARCGFEPLATLIYLRRKVPRREAHRPLRLPPGFSLLQYTPAAEPLLAQALARSYIDSLDCPALRGLRSVEEAILGHKAAGEFRPEWWHILMRDDTTAPQPVGAMLLNGAGLGASGGLELVYLGLDPLVRGQGLGDAMVCFALDLASATPGRSLMLAVDAENAPALSLYRRHSLRIVQKRVAMLRDVRGVSGERQNNALLRRL